MAGKYINLPTSGR